jgi:adenosylcobinamide-GDP ribazoletransferase
MNALKNELAALLAAVRFFTRLPMPQWIGHSQAQLDHAARYFPLVGALVGCVGALFTGLVAWALPPSLAVGIGMVMTILFTGAFHEDGLADACDGFGGGWDKSQVLAIMKDSRIGSYGAIALVMALLLKYTALHELALLEFAEDSAAPALAVVLISGHALSRLAPVLLMRFLPYVRDDATGKAKPLATAMSAGGLSCAILFACAPLLLLPAPAALSGLFMVLLSTWLCGRYFHRRIGGYTGDCLGASQQISELGFYLAVLITANTAL